MKKWIQIVIIGLKLFVFNIISDLSLYSQSGLTIWVNNGEDKVTRDELRAAQDLSGVTNSVWDGNKITLFGAKNEVVAFNLILEAPAEDIAASWINVAEKAAWQNSADHFKEKPDKRVFLYNSNRPAAGSFAIEDDGVALRVLAWAQY